jgi:signal peptidase II
MSGWDEAMSLNKVSPMIGVFAALAAFAIDQITKAS